MLLSKNRNEKMATLTVTKEQLRLIQDALDMYFRIGIGQMIVIKDHPTFEKTLRKKCTFNGEVDYAIYHEQRKIADHFFTEGRDTLLLDTTHGVNGSYGIYNQENVHESSTVAYDLVQVIRHEFWKADPNRSEHVVMSSVHLSTKDSGKIKVEL
jgi:hypothetical protein